MKKLIVVLTLCLLSFPASAIVITQCSSPGTFTQNNGAITVGCNNFDRAEFTFSGVFANSIQIANIGANAIFDIHGSGNPRTAEVDVLILGVWTNIFTSVAYNVSTALSTVLAAPMSFTGATITGLRLDVNLPVNQAYHLASISSQMTYTTSVVQIPEPGTLALLGLGLAAIGFSRRRKTQQPA